MPFVDSEKPFEGNAPGDDKPGGDKLVAAELAATEGNNEVIIGLSVDVGIEEEEGEVVDVLANIAAGDDLEAKVGSMR